MKTTLKTIENKVKNCTKCQLCETRKNSVPGKGNYHSEIILVGEAPGRTEDNRGEPFVGSAGKKLDEALEDAGLSRESIYITNIVKCRPPNNRIPTEEEKNTCRAYLDAEFSLIKPKLICLMGNTAFNSLLGGGNITKNRGKIIKKDNQTFFVTVHPAATIYNKDLLIKLKQDMKKLAQIVSKIN